MSDIFGSIQGLPHAGETLSAISALIWAVSVVLFRVVGQKIHALALSFFKNVLALVLFGLTIAGFGGAFPAGLSAGGYGLLVISGLLGVAISDTLFFMALQRLGAELLAIVDCAYAPFVIGLSFLFLGERMNGIQTAGVGLIILAVFLITRRKTETQIPRSALLSGIGLGVASMFATAAGIVMIKPLLRETPLLWASLVRMAAGALSIAGAIAVHPRRKNLIAPLRESRNLVRLATPSFLGAYLSLIFWMEGMKLTQASIASALNQLNTIFIFILAAIFLKEKITPLKLAAVGLAFAGAMLVSVPL